jgi:hypothetical protein
MGRWIQSSLSSEGGTRTFFAAFPHLYITRLYLGRNKASGQADEDEDNDATPDTQDDAKDESHDGEDSRVNKKATKIEDNTDEEEILDEAASEENAAVGVWANREPDDDFDPAADPHGIYDAD